MSKNGLYKAQYAAALQDEEKGEIIRDLEEKLDDKDSEIASLESAVSDLEDKVEKLGELLDAIACDAKDAMKII